jgi:hypothetical protein
MSTGGSVSTNSDKLTLANIRDGIIKYKKLRKNKLQLLCGTFLDHIEDLERKLRIEKAKVEKANVEANAKAKALVEHKAEYNELKKTIGDRELELRLEKAKAPHNVSTSTPQQNLQAQGRAQGVEGDRQGPRARVEA